MQRDLSIDVLKFFAVVLITNSHFDIMYQQCSFLATGGAIGDALFFFVSGFTILLGSQRSFANYYKRRINRIYPTIFAWALLSCLFFNKCANMADVILHGGGWFVSCIMIYYVIFYFVKKYCLKYLRLILWLSLLVGSLIYFLFSDSETFSMYGQTYYKWIFNFVFMLEGALLGYSKQGDVKSTKSVWNNMFRCCLCVICFYALCVSGRVIGIDIQVFSLIPLMGICYYAYELCCTSKLKVFFSSTKCGYIMSVIGGLCLEIYLVQYNIITNKLNSIFPLNLLIIFCLILSLAYILRCVSRIWSWTFRDGEYDWKAIFSLKN